MGKEVQVWWCCVTGVGQVWMMLEGVVLTHTLLVDHKDCHTPPRWALVAVCMCMCVCVCVCVPYRIPSSKETEYSQDN